MSIAPLPVSTPAVAPPLRDHAVAADIAALPPDAELCTVGDLTLFHVRGADAPAVLYELGRLRELTFRAVGQGVGKPLDLDLHDLRCTHVVAWHDGRQEIVGAYRLADVDRTVARHGVRGLYLNSLWEFDRDLVRELEPAVELGRSFIRPEHQRSALALAALWRGVGAVIARWGHPPLLLGAATLGALDDGPALWRRVGHLAAHHRDPWIARRIRPRVPLIAPDDEARDALRDGAAAHRLGRADLPALVRHYLALGARIGGFNVDPAFGGCADAWLVVDLRDVDARLRARFLGVDDAACVRPAA